MADGGEESVSHSTEDSQVTTSATTDGSGEVAKPPAPKGPVSEAEKKGFMLMDQAEAKVKSASGFFGKLMGLEKMHC